MVNTLFTPIRCQKQVDVFTLNHDLIVESSFNLNSTHLEDGFYPNENGLYCFDSGRFFDSKEKYRLFKLHGSVNWYSHNPRMIKASDPHNIPDLFLDVLQKAMYPVLLQEKSQSFLNIPDLFLPNSLVFLIYNYIEMFPT